MTTKSAHTSASERFKGHLGQGRSAYEEKAVDAEELHTRIFTYIQAVVYARAILSRNIKRDCMADLCKYLWPANKRVLAEPKRKAEG